jgi:hypothetical protein
MDWNWLPYMNQRNYTRLVSVNATHDITYRHGFLVEPDITLCYFSSDENKIIIKCLKSLL